MTRVMRLKLTHRRQTRKNSEAKFSILNLKKKTNKQITIEIIRTKSSTKTK
jgi:hypothetical protein